MQAISVNAAACGVTFPSGRSDAIPVPGEEPRSHSTLYTRQSVPSDFPINPTNRRFRSVDASKTQLWRDL